MLWKMRNGLNMSKRMGVWCFALVFLVTTALVATEASAQVLYGSITGTVTDATSAAVPNVAVTVTNQATGETREDKTDNSGSYLIRDLSAGPYTVEIKSAGNFGGYTQKNIPITANQEVRVNIPLQLASVKSEVTVTSAAATLQTETAEVNHQISQSMISELPISSSQGRNYQALYTLIPGAANVIEQNSTGSNPSRAESLNVNGVEDMSNTTRIDGAVNTYGWLPYLVAYVPPADSIQTVNITTNSFNAEQGVAGGASINVIIKGGTNQFHGSVWEYYQGAKLNARGYTATQASLVSALNPTGSIPKNVFNQYGFSIGGPVYIPKILKGKDKLFFFQDFERTTRRQLITGTQTVPTVAMLGGDFSAVPLATTTLYNPYTNADCTGPILPAGSRTPFPGNVIPQACLARAQSVSALTMLALLKPISATVTNPNYTGFLANDYNGSGTLKYNRNTSDSKITYNPSDRTSIFGRYSVEPFSVADPQELGAAGGGTFDGGQPGQAKGRIQNVGLGMSHVITPNLVIDADFGYTRQVTGAQSDIDIAAGNYGLDVLKIPGTNGPGLNYAGQPEFVFNGGATTFSSIGNSNGANPFLFRDNQFTADVNLSYTKGHHATKYGFTYYHFDLNHFQPTSGGGVASPRGGFNFQGGLTANSTGGFTNYNALADFILGVPNNGTGIAIATERQLTDPDALRWSEFAGYAQDQWTITPKITINYGVRYEMYPVPYRDKQGIFRLDPALPQTANVIVGGIGGNPKNTGVDVGYGFFAPRLGIAYRLTDKTVIRTGAGLTSDPDSMRFLRDQFPIDLSPTYTGNSAGAPSVDPTTGTILTLATGIPALVIPDISKGILGLPVALGTNTIPQHYRRGYIESWNLFLQQDLGGRFVANVGYVGTHQVRQLVGHTLNAAPLPSNSTICMANGQYNPSSGFTGACSFNANQIINAQHCPASSFTNPVCYNTGGITMNEPLFSSNYNALQAQLTRNAGRLAQFGLIYTWSHAFDYEDNGAGSGSEGLKFSYPAYYKMNRANAGYDRTNNLQFWGIYHLPFGAHQAWANHGIVSAIVGGFQLNGQLSHVSGAPFSVSANSNQLNAPGGGTEYADLVAPYHQLSGHSQKPGTPVSGGMPWFDPSSFANPVEPAFTVAGNSSSTAPHFGNTHRNQFRGPGVTTINASIFRGFHVFRESEFQVRVEAFNLLNHAVLPTPNNVTVPSGACSNTNGPTFSTTCTGLLTLGTSTSAFGYINGGFGAARTLQFSGRFNF